MCGVITTAHLIHTFFASEPSEKSKYLVFEEEKNELTRSLNKGAENVSEFSKSIYSMSNVTEKAIVATPKTEKLRDIKRN